MFTCESNLLAANRTPVLFLLVLAGVFVVRVVVRGAGAGAAGARSTLIFQLLKTLIQKLYYANNRIQSIDVRVHYFWNRKTLDSKSPFTKLVNKKVKNRNSPIHINVNTE